jgi:hypothetical protein
MRDHKTNISWETPELKALDVSETQEGIPADVPEGTEFTNDSFPGVVILAGS